MNHRWGKDSLSICPHCGHMIEIGDAYCIECGASLTQTTSQNNAFDERDYRPETSECPYCGAPTEMGDSFCTVCGRPLPNIEGANTLSSEIVDLSMLPSIDEPPEEVGSCPSCGNPVLPGDAFCTICGNPLSPTDGMGYPNPTGTEAIEDDRPTEELPIVADVCPSCGATITSGNAYCTICGHPLRKEPKEKLQNLPAGFDPIESQLDEVPLKTSEKCPHCGNLVAPDDIFCTRCGQGLKHTKVEDSQDAAMGVNMTVDQPDEEQPAETRYCLVCGSPMRPGDSFCKNCSGTYVESKPRYRSGDASPWKEMEVLPKESADTETYIRAERQGEAFQPAEPPILSAGSSVINEDDTRDDDDPYVLAKLMTITVDEAREGCKKPLTLEDGSTIYVDVPPATNPGTKIDIPGLGLINKVTGKRGPLRISFFILR